MTTEALGLWVSPWRMRAMALWKQVQQFSRREPKRLRLCESLPLGERRFVAVVEFDAARFLVGGTPSSLVLLSRLDDASLPAGDEQRIPGGKRIEANRRKNNEPEEKC